MEYYCHNRLALQPHGKQFFDQLFYSRSVEILTFAKFKLMKGLNNKRTIHYFVVDPKSGGEHNRRL